MTDIITLDRVSKSFNIYNRPADLVREVFTRRKLHDVFWALRDVSFSLAPRQRLGLIGPNGSGKTTLLRMISGNLEPTSGTMAVHGRISAMLSLNSILNPDETGFENIRFNLLVNGCPRREVEAKIEDIIDFAELGPFVYKPVRTFSSGMNARLAFALTTALEPDILLVDEVLSVGDAYFVGKAMKRMLEVCDRGRALLFVSHSTSDVQRLCDTVLWLDQGVVRRFGPARDVVQEYEDDARRQEDEATREANAARRFKAEYLSFVEELGEDLFRVRLVPESGGRFVDTHYVRRVAVSAEHMTPVEILPGQSEPLPSTSWTWLDPIGCEWGRLHEHISSQCRLLYTQSGRKHGGHVIVRRPAEAAAAWPIDIEIEASSDKGDERLALEFLDLATGAWQPAERIAGDPQDRGWTRTRFRFSVPKIEREQVPELVSKFIDRHQGDVEITEVAVVSRGERVASLHESIPFEVQVTIRSKVEVPVIDVGIRINRVDGSYVFWQSSGMNAPNIQQLLGRAVVSFHFDPNVLGAGNYIVSATAHDGWDVEQNYPYHHVFARKSNAAELTITREDPRLDFGQVNVRVPVSVERIPE